MGLGSRVECCHDVAKASRVAMTVETQFRPPCVAMSRGIDVILNIEIVCNDFLHRAKMFSAEQHKQVDPSCSS